MYKKFTHDAGVEYRHARDILRIMKLTIFILTLGMLQLSLASKAQKVSLSEENTALSKVFRKISQQTGYGFLVEGSTLKNTTPLTIQVSNLDLEQVLALIEKEQPITFRVEDQAVIVSKKITETIRILAFPIVKGRIVDSIGNPLIGASIRVLNADGKRTALQTSTDRDGRFELRNVPEDAVLEVSYLGYVTTTIKAAADVGAMVLRAVQSELDEVEVMVNTGYQQLKANEINGAITVIDNNTLQKQVGPNILSRLQGVTNGLTFQVGRNNPNPQNETGITIRGYSTINGPLDPLIVIDNFVYDGDINTINPNDVENVSILKDAAATSIYGARGGNGVIVITTKRGKADKMRVAADVNMTVSEKPNLDPLPLMMNTDYIEVEEMLFNAGYFNSNLTNRSAPAITPMVYYLDRLKKETITDEEYQNVRQFYANTDFRKQYSDTFHRQALLNQYGLNISGGTSNYTWFMSANHNRYKNNFAEPSQRTNLRINNDIKLGKKVSAKISASYTQRKEISNNISTYTNLMAVGRRQQVPYMSLFDEEGVELPFYQVYNKNLIDTVGKGRLHDWNFYPVSDPNFSDFTNNNAELLGNIGVDYQITKGLKIGVYYQIQTETAEQKRHYFDDSFYVRNLVNRFSQINETTGEVTYNVPNGDIISFGMGKEYGQSARSQLDLSQKFFNHDIKAILGVEARENEAGGGGWTNYGYYEDPLSFTPVNHLVYYRTQPTGSTATISGSPSIEPTIINRFISLYGNFAYTFKDKYSLSGSFRKDGSNIYGVSTNEKWKPLWSVALGYDLAREKFINNSIFNTLRVRSSLGYSGNVDLSKSALPIAYYYNNSQDLGGLRAALIETLNNPSLRWEQVKQVNFGVDVSLKNFPISATVDFYTKYGKDLYGITDYDYTTWGLHSTIIKNVAEMKGKGIDMNLRYQLQGRVFEWNSSFIYNYSLSKTHKYYLPDNAAPLSRLLSNSGTQITPVEGFPLYAVGGYIWKGLDDQGNPQGYLNGQVSTDYNAIINSSRAGGAENETIRLIGSATPTHFGAWSNDFRFKGFTLGFNLVYKLGYYFRKQSISYSALVNNGAGHADFSKRWQKEGDNTTVPSFQYPLVAQNRDNFYLASEHLVKRGDHIRLQFINLSYNFGDTIKFFNINAFANCSNLGLLWSANKENLDPDYPYQIRPERTFSIGLRTNF